MQTVVRDMLRRQLEDRRTRLLRAVSNEPDDGDLVALLGRVDSALTRVESEAYGRCLVCEEAVSERDLLLNPLLEYCLCNLTPKQQRALEHDLGLARRLQAGLLPDPDLRRSGWSAHYRYEPAGVVSGDYCDLWSHPDDPETIFFAVADVSGKGVAASLLMAHLQASFRSLLGAGVPMSELVTRVNRQLLEASLPTHYATLACGLITADGHVEIVNAGHCPPVVVRRDGVETLGPTGLPVGLVEDRPYEVTRLSLREGEALVLYTDGLTEARDPRDEEYAVARLTAALARGAWGNARGIVRSVRADLESFTGGARLQDDLTVMALVRTGTTERNVD
jgi:sigma-B regulation protein RsbU (phosphoserine phosphatase)